MPSASTTACSAFRRQCLRHLARHRAQFLLPGVARGHRRGAGGDASARLAHRPGAARAVKGGSTMAEAMGIDTFRVKVTAFVIAALLASISGWLFAHFQRTVNPSPFGLNMGIEYLFMAVLGGVGHVWGAIVGAGVVQILKDQLQVWLPKLMGTSGNYEIIVFGILLVFVLQYAREGLWAFVEGLLPRFRRKVDWGHAEPLPTRLRPPHGQVVLEVDTVRKTFGGLVAVNDALSFRGPGREIPLFRPGRPERRRQVDDLQPGDRRAARDQRRGFFQPALQPIYWLRSLQDRARLGVSRTFQHVKMIAATRCSRTSPFAHLARPAWRSAMLRTDREEERRLMREAELPELPHRHRRVDRCTSRKLGNLLALRPAAADGDRPGARLCRPDPVAARRAGGGPVRYEKETCHRLAAVARRGLVDPAGRARHGPLVMGLVDRVVVMESEQAKRTPRGSPGAACGAGGLSRDGALDGCFLSCSVLARGSPPGAGPATGSLSFAGPNESNQSKGPQYDESQLLRSGRSLRWGFRIGSGCVRDEELRQLSFLAVALRPDRAD